MGRRVAGLVLLPLLALSGCASNTSPAAPPVTAAVTAPTSATTKPAPVHTPTSVVTPRMLPAYRAHPTGPGCPKTATALPASALTARIGDVDGDGRADIEWARLVPSGMQFGISTASGATASKTVDFAGGGTRSLVISKLGNGAVIALPSEERGVQLYAFAHCTFRTPHGVNQRPYYFEQGDRTGPGTGTGVGCIAGHLVGYEVTLHGRTATITATPVNVSTDGSTATNGSTTTLARNLSTSSEKVQRAGSATCGASPVLLPTFTQ